MHFLSGNVSFDILAVFETKKKLNKTWGKYAKPIKFGGNLYADLLKVILGFGESFIADEYCTPRYSNKDFKLIKYSENLWGQWREREEQPKLIWKEQNTI